MLEYLLKEGNHERSRIVGAFFHYKKKEDIKMRKVIINGKEYTIPEVTFDAVCDLEDAGLNLLDLASGNVKLTVIARACVAWVTHTSPAGASKILAAHLADGGDLGSVVSPIWDAIEESGFFTGKKVPQDHRKPRQTRNGNGSGTNRSKK